MPDGKKKAMTVAELRKAKRAARKKPSPPQKAAATPDPPLAPVPAVALTEIQQFFVLGNMEVLEPYEIAAKIDVPVAAVEDFIRSTHQQAGVGRTDRLFQRPRVGVVAMTEAASMRADDMRQRGLITQAEINRAAAAGDYDLAAELARKRENQQVDAVAQQKARYGHCIHFIRGPGYRPQADDRRYPR